MDDDLRLQIDLPLGWAGETSLLEPSADGTFVAIASGATISIVDASSFRERLRLIGHRDTVTALTLSPDGRRLVSCAHDQTMRVFCLESGRELREPLVAPRGLSALFFTSDGASLVTFEYHHVAVRDAVSFEETGRSRLSNHGPSCFSHDGKLAAIASFRDGTIDLHSLPSGTQVGSLLRRETDRMMSAADGLRFSRDGARFAAGARDGELSVWDVGSKELRWSCQAHQAEITRVAFSGDGDILASSGSDDFIRLWSADTGEALRTLVGHTARVDSLEIAPDGAMLWSAASKASEVIAWRLTTGAVVHRNRPPAAPIYGLAVSPDGRTVAIGADGEVVLVGADGRMRALAGFKRAVAALAFTPDGRTLGAAGGDGIVRLWDATTGELRRAITPPPVDGWRPEVWSLAFDPGGLRVLSVQLDKTLRTRSVATGDFVDQVPTNGLGSLLAAPELLLAAPFDTARDEGSYPAPDPAHLADVILDGDPSRGFWIRRVEGKQETTFLVRGFADPPRWFALRRDGGLLATTETSGVLRLWDLEARACVLTLPAASLEVPFGSKLPVTFSADGATLLLGRSDGSITFLRAADGVELGVLHAARGGAFALAFAADGKVELLGDETLARAAAIGREGAVCLPFEQVEDGRRGQGLLAAWLGTTGA